MLAHRESGIISIRYIRETPRMTAMFRLSMLLVFLTPTSVSAGNQGFLPGDAFFHTILRQDDCERMQEEDAPTLGYVPPDWVDSYFCGYYGYWQLQLPPQSRPLVQNLQNVYRSIREFNPRQLVEYKSFGGIKLHETNGLHVLVYNADYNPTDYPIGLRWNESWVEDQMAFGVPRKETRLQLFDRSDAAYEQEWRNAGHVPRLNTNCADKETAIDAIHKGKAMATCQGPVQLIVLESEKLGTFVSPRAETTFYSVTDKSVKRYRYVKKEWVVVDWKPGMIEEE